MKRSLDIIIVGAEVVRLSNVSDALLMGAEVVLPSTAAILLLVVLGDVAEESVAGKDGVVLVDADCVGTVVRETGDDEVVLPSA